MGIFESFNYHNCTTKGTKNQFSNFRPKTIDWFYSSTSFAISSLRPDNRQLERLNLLVDDLSLVTHRQCAFFLLL